VTRRYSPPGRAYLFRPDLHVGNLLSHAMLHMVLTGCPKDDWPTPVPPATSDCSNCHLVLGVWKQVRQGPGSRIARHRTDNPVTETSTHLINSHCKYQRSTSLRYPLCQNRHKTSQESNPFFFFRIYQHKKRKVELMSQKLLAKYCPREFLILQEASDKTTK